MAEKSGFWTTGTTGDGATTYNQDIWAEWLRDSFTTDRYDTEGVLAGVANQLAVSGTASPISVGTGAAYVYGHYYQNTSAVSLNVPTAAAGTTGHRVVLRADWTAQTVRIVLKSSSDGNATPPGVTQSAGSTWEISLATLTRTTGGTITITDTRDYCRPSPAHIYRRQGGSASNWTTVGSNIYIPAETKLQLGAVNVTFPSSANSNLVTVTFPVAYEKAPHVHVQTFNGGSSTNRKCVFSVETTTETQVQIRGYISDGSSTSNTIVCLWMALGE